MECSLNYRVFVAKLGFADVQVHSMLLDVVWLVSVYLLEFDVR